MALATSPGTSSSSKDSMELHSTDVEFCQTSGLWTTQPGMCQSDSSKEQDVETCFEGLQQLHLAQIRVMMVQQSNRAQSRAAITTLRPWQTSEAASKLQRKLSHQPICQSMLPNPPSTRTLKDRSHILQSSHQWVIPKL